MVQSIIAVYNLLISDKMPLYSFGKVLKFIKIKRILKKLYLIPVKTRPQFVNKTLLSYLLKGT